MVHTLSKSICPNVNEVARLGFELTFYDIAVQHISHHGIKIAFEISPTRISLKMTVKSTETEKHFQNILCVNKYK